MWFTALSWICKLIGLSGWAESLIRKVEADRKAQRVADAPSTDKEWADAADKGDL
jgi:hypothetical protein